jgi:hypothetical protein
MFNDETAIFQLYHGENKLQWIKDNVSTWSDMSTGGMLFKWTSTNKSNLSVQVLNKADSIMMIWL